MRLIDADATLDTLIGLTEQVHGEGAALTKALVFAALKSRTVTPSIKPEPRIITIDEVEDALDTVVWLETPGQENLADGYSLIMAYSRPHKFVLFDSPFGDNPSQDRYEYDEYGKTWRCWNKRPTEIQRGRVKWDDL